MEKKNRFSELLQHLMTLAELKNYTLAQELQYDVSYISKWVSGRMLPSEKTADQILLGISNCVANAASPTGQQRLLEEYQLDSVEDLKFAINDHLTVEYQYCRDLQRKFGSSIAPETFFHAELVMKQYIAAMTHPVLRRVNSLNIMSAIDLMSIDRDHRMQLVNIHESQSINQHSYPNVQFSLLINTDLTRWDPLYDTIFLLNMLTNMSNIDFQLYGSPLAAGRAIFAVKNAFSISGMLLDRNRCMSVVISENPNTCNTLYYNISDMCQRELLLFRKVSIAEILMSHDYAHALLAPNQRWLLGHLTEHFLPDDLFEELLDQVSHSLNHDIQPELLRRNHQLSRKIATGSHLKLMIYESAFSDLIISQELDFYNHKIHLTHKQQLRYLEYFYSIYESSENLDLRLVYGRFSPDCPYILKPCIFLSDVLSYLRLDSGHIKNNLLLINRADIQILFDNFYQEAWESRSDIVASDRDSILAYINHMIQGLHLITENQK